MNIPSPNLSLDESDFFEHLPGIADAAGTFDVRNYRAAPAEWQLIITDIEDSSGAIADGRHNAVNIVAASAIAALKNLCAPVPVPFLFGGDGAVVLVPARYAAEARIALARLRSFAARECRLTLRVGMVAVGEVRRFGVDVLVGRYEPSPGNTFGVFLGGGVSLLEASIKGVGDPDLSRRAAVSPSLDDGAPVDMSGLSCRWNALKSLHGAMVTLIVEDTVAPHETFAEVMQLAAAAGDPRPARRENLKASWPSKGFVLEARVGRGRGSLLFAIVRVLAETLLARLVFARGRPAGRFDPDRYREEVARNTDFCKFDDVLCLVLDCPASSVEAIRRLLDGHAARGRLRYGMHVSELALMTCLVSSATENRHVHFIDGGDGGYTSAAKRLKLDSVAPNPNRDSAELPSAEIAEKRHGLMHA